MVVRRLRLGYEGEEPRTRKTRVVDERWRRGIRRQGWKRKGGVLGCEFAIVLVEVVRSAWSKEMEQGVSNPYRTLIPYSNSNVD